MKPSEKVVLDTLRKTTLAYLSESDYAQIEKAVEQKGILNLTGTASILVKSAVQKHEGGGHDQDSHGSWAGNGAGGKNIQDMSASDQKEFIDRMSSAKSGAEQRAIIDEFKGRQKGGDTSKSPATPLASPAGKTFSHPAQTRSLNSIANEIVSDPNYKGSTKTYAQPYIAAMHQMNDIGDNYYADSGDSVVRYALSNLSTWRGEKARTIKAELKAMLKSLDSPVSKATSVKTGDMVSTLKKKVAVAKHGSHDQSSHGAWANGKYNTDDSEGEDESEPKNYKGKKPKISYDAEDSEGEYTDSNYDDPKWMDDMDITHPPKRK